MKLDEYFKGTEVIVNKESYSIIKARKPVNNAFAVIKDKNEITIITSNVIDEKNVIKKEDDWRLITFNVILPFELVGFIAKISTKLAKEGISIFVISTYSTDHILIKEKDLEKNNNYSKRFRV